MAEYEPGVCNIGEGEQRKRYALGAVALVATLGLFVGVLTTGAPTLLLLASVVPLFGVAEGYFQGRHNFCTGFATLGIYDTSDDGTDRREVPDASARRADRQRARQIHAKSATAAVGATILVYAVGLLSF
ncbi:hypothetical protein AUR64_10220 [Haloprofundus marisrubri]|uniref:DUF2892 domain-containing protein n=1 Tax=Haloprofundus marisrubri TaxID=1514971 RepID=A0A0W1R949_9EURY|nr:hypothetical protein [Haloprofundus marisrubri]KTG09976.1 hypothetical protein AUR64_10220 [Haloprofundus marisrubri]